MFNNAAYSYKIRGKHQTSVLKGLKFYFFIILELVAWMFAASHLFDAAGTIASLFVVLKMGMHVYDKAGSVVRKFAKPADPKTDPDHVVTLCR